MNDYLNDILQGQAQSRATGRGNLSSSQVESAFKGAIAAKYDQAERSRQGDMQQQALNEQISASQEQRKNAPYQTAISGVGALGTAALGYASLQKAGVIPKNAITDVAKGAYNTVANGAASLFGTGAGGAASPAYVAAAGQGAGSVAGAAGTVAADASLTAGTEAATTLGTTATTTALAETGTMGAAAAGTTGAEAAGSALASSTAAGSTIGPWGTAIGAVVGLVVTGVQALTKDSWLCTEVNSIHRLSDEQEKAMSKLRRYVIKNHREDAKAYLVNGHRLVDKIKDDIDSVARFYESVNLDLVIPCTDLVLKGDLEGAYIHYKTYTLDLCLKHNVDLYKEIE